MSLLSDDHRRIAGVVSIAVVAACGLIPAAPAAAAPGRSAVAGTHPSWAHTRAGSTPPPVTSGTVDVRVYLASRDPSGLAAFARAVSDPRSTGYGHYLSPAQVQARFAPTGTEASAVRSWLSGAGMSTTEATTGIAAYVEATGTVAAASRAFGVSFARYTDPEGSSARAPESTATVPSSVAADVASVAGLDTGNHEMRPADTLPKPGPNYWVAPPTSSYYGQNVATTEPTAEGAHQPWTVAGYTPAQVRGAYGVTGSGMTGAGQTVAVVDAYASPTMLSDADQFAQTVGDQPFQSGQYQEFLPAKYTQVSDKQCGAQGWYGEQTLDVESVHGTAPRANVDYVGAASCDDQDLLAADALIVNRKLATIVTDSWGESADGEGLTGSYEQTFEAGAAEGIGFLFSSGDSGYEDPTTEDPGYSDKLQVDYPTSSPWVTSVGGTSLAIGRTNNYQWETSWGTVLDPLASSGDAWTDTPPPPFNADTYDGSSGGGVSTEFQQPPYQTGVVSPGLAKSLPDGTTSSVPMRVVPDVAALADPSTGILVGETTLNASGKGYAFALSRIGGTSVASPVFAGIEADAQQAAGHDIGFANPAIYARAGTRAFHDVTDTPFGPGVHLYEVRNNYSDPDTATGPLLTYLRLLGEDGSGASALPAVHGYDDATGVGSPAGYIGSF